MTISSLLLALLGALGGPCPPASPLGANYCFTQPNGTGVPAAISAFGIAGGGPGCWSTALTASGVPDTVGIFFYGSVQTSVPFECSYLICTSNAPTGGIGAVTRIGPPVFGAGGIATTTFVPPTPGSYNFQYWFRDAPCAGVWPFGFSDALTTPFTG